MATKTFISWSGDLSERLGEALRQWLPGVLQYVKPYFTPRDVEKGTKWDPDIARELEDSNIGLICLTPDNKDEAWILFEAGALSKSLEKSRVCPILFNLDTADLKGPLATFQATRFNRDDIKKLVQTINKAAGDDKLEPQILENVFKMWWPKLEQQVSEILASHTEDNPKPSRPDRDILEEMLELTRMSASRSRLAPQSVSRVDRRAVRALTEGLSSLTHRAWGEGIDVLHLLRLMLPLDGSLIHICSGAGIPKAYDDFRLRQEELRNLALEESEEAEQEN